VSSPQLGLLEAIDDQRLLGASFVPWPRQREILASIEAGPRVQVLALGRRSGKTTMGAVFAVHQAVFRPDLDRLVRRGEKRFIVGVATRLDQAKIFLNAAKSVLSASPVLAGLVEGETEDSITFANAVITAMPATARGTRGWAVSTIVMDEAAHHVDSDGNQAAEPLYNALANSAQQFGKEARIIVASTPFGESGWFSEMFHRADRGDLPGAAAHRFSSIETNPLLDPEVLEQERVRDPDSYRGEILAEFIGSGNAFIDPERLRDVVSDRGELGRHEGADFVVGLDLGFASDPTGVCVTCRDPADRSLLRVALARAWAPQAANSFEERRAIEDRLLEDVADLALHYGARVVSDQFVAPAVRHRLGQRGVYVTTMPLTADTKSTAFIELRSRIYTHGIELYEHPGLLAELRQLKTQFAANRSSVVTPRTSKGHSDMAVALALAVWMHDRSGIPGPRREKPEPIRSPMIANEAALDQAMGTTSRDRTRKGKWWDRPAGIHNLEF
jgi:hypothetical protein